MLKTNKLNNPPIKEAVIELIFSNNRTINEIEKCIDKNINENIDRKTINAFSEEFTIDKEKKAGNRMISQEIEGYRLENIKEGIITTIRKDRVSISIVKDRYPGWETFWDLAKKEINNYCEFGSNIINRIGLRYINIIELPLNFSSFNEYFKIFPNIPPQMPSALSKMLLNLTIPKRDFLFANVMQTFSDINEKKNILPYTFDIDVISYEPLPFDFGKIEKKFDELREFRNEIFVGNLTEKCMELFK